MHVSSRGRFETRIGDLARIKEGPALSALGADHASGSIQSILMAHGAARGTSSGLANALTQDLIRETLQKMG